MTTDLVPVAGRELWEPLDGESIKAFHAFALYRDLGPYRSLAKAAQLLIDDGTRNGTPAGIRKDLGVWSSRFHWVERCEAFELYRDRRDREVTEEETDRMKRRHAQLAQLMTGAAMERLVGRRAGRAPDGSAIAAVERLDPADLDAMGVARLATAGIEAERLSRGLPTTLTQAMNTLTRTEAQNLWTALIELALARLPEDQHEAFLRDVQAIGEKRA